MGRLRLHRASQNLFKIPKVVPLFRPPTLSIAVAHLCIVQGAIVRLQALPGPVLGGLGLRGAHASTTGLGELPTLSLLLNVRCKAY